MYGEIVQLAFGFAIGLWTAVAIRDRDRAGHAMVWVVGLALVAILNLVC
jgi:hypothetical protein